jgi:hypothetical protein
MLNFFIFYNSLDWENPHTYYYDVTPITLYRLQGWIPIGREGEEKREIQYRKKKRS